MKTLEARIDSYRVWVEGSADSELKSLLQQLLEGSGFTILNFMEHYFEPHGYTAVWLLAESHCALHTFPEQNRSYIELSSCNLEMYEDFISSIDSYFTLISS